MKAKRRTLLVLAALVVLAGLALAVLERQNAAEEEAASAAAEGAISLSAFAVSDLTRIAYTYNGETYTLEYDGGAWTLAEDPDYHLDASACDTMATALSALNAKRQLTAGAGEDYGFAEPLVTVTVTAAGQTNTFVFGAQNAITGDIYLQKEGDDAVYTVAASKVSCFELGKAELFEPFNPAGLTASAIEAVSYTLADGETVALRAVSEPEDSGSEAASDSAESEADADSAAYTTVWRLDGDPDAALDEEKTEGILSALGSYVTAQQTGADPAQYGFDAPLVTVEAVTAEGSVTLAYASGTDGYYLRVEGDSSVYSVDGSTVQALLCSAQELRAADAAEPAA